MSTMPYLGRLSSWLAFEFAILVCLGGVALATNAGEAARPRLGYVSDISPILTKAGCSAGVCHAKAGGGQAGFQLSLLGFEPELDHRQIVSAARGRRLNLANAEQSLLLRKASGEAPHGGGVRLQPGSKHYKTLRKWIQQGAPLHTANQSDLKAIEIVPAEATMRPGDEQPLQVIASYADGTTRDVTPLALYESNEEAMVHVTEAGQVVAGDIPGNASVMVRYQAKVAVFNAAIPLDAPTVEMPPENNFVDKHVFANLSRLKIPPSQLCDDATFLRRVTLDIGGRIPTEAETKAFLISTEADRRSRVIERLLRSPDYADYFANKWTAVLKNRRDDASDIKANFAFHAWIRDNLLVGTPYDQMVRELLAATGTIISNPPVAWYKRVKDPKQQIEDVAQLFLGVRLQCAQCHHHPFERWSQTDYYGMTAFFSRVGRKPTDTAGEDLIFHQRGEAVAKDLKSGQTVRPIALGDDVGKISPSQDPRLFLAKWMSREDNPFFAKALVNRYWKHFFGRGLVEPEDDLRDTNPPSNPALMDALATHFVESGFDLKELVRVITNSKAYQLSAIPNEHNAKDHQNYSRYYTKRLQAEVMLDAIDQVTRSKTSFANLPNGTRAVALPDNSYNRQSPFLRVFGRPEATSVCECERVQNGSLAQSLHLINANEIKGKLSAGNGFAARMLAEKRSPEEQITALYRAAYSRDPSEAERTVAIEYLSQEIFDAAGKPLPKAKADAEKLQDLVWALINTKEFLFNH